MQSEAECKKHKESLHTLHEKCKQREVEYNIHHEFLVTIRDTDVDAVVTLKYAKEESKEEKTQQSVATRNKIDAQIGTQKEKSASLVKKKEFDSDRVQALAQERRSSLSLDRKQRNRQKRASQIDAVAAAKKKAEDDDDQVLEESSSSSDSGADSGSSSDDGEDLAEVEKKNQAQARIGAQNRKKQKEISVDSLLDLSDLEQ